MYNRIEEYEFENDKLKEEFREASILLANETEGEVTFDGKSIEIACFIRWDSYKGRCLYYMGENAIDRGRTLGVYLGKIVRWQSEVKNNYTMKFQSKQLQNFLISAEYSGTCF